MGKKPLFTRELYGAIKIIAGDISLKCQSWMASKDNEAECLRTAGTFPAKKKPDLPLANHPMSPDIKRSGGWWWTSHSPTGSGPEGSSPNEPRHGSPCQPPTLHRKGTRIAPPEIRGAFFDFRAAPGKCLLAFPGKPIKPCPPFEKNRYGAAHG
jgi:hypothetical protein